TCYKIQDKNGEINTPLAQAILN
ncbi:MAG: hypothetical protein RIT03_340, partial [Bacteroidota bacterium]